jgi:hypothetical protein
VDLIVANVRSKFEIKDDEDIVTAITNKVLTIPGHEKALSDFLLYWNRLNNFQAMIFTAFRIKDRDNVLLQFKDNKGTIRKEEELRVSNGFKVDFSTGIILTGLKDDEYVFKDTTVPYLRPGATTPTDTTGKFIIKENSSSRKIGFSIMAHGYPRLSSNYNLGITTGISVNTDTEINLLAGLSLMLGSQRRIVFSGGFIWGKADRLSNTVQSNFSRKDGNPAGTAQPVFYTAADNVVPVVNDWYRSWFAGVSYNFSARR